MEDHEAQSVVPKSGDRAMAISLTTIEQCAGVLSRRNSSRLSAQDANSTCTSDVSDPESTPPEMGQGVGPPTTCTTPAPGANQREKIIWATRALALVLLAVGIAQWEHAAKLRSKEIAIREEYWLPRAGYFFTEAGQPWVGIWACILAVCMLFWSFNARCMKWTAPVAIACLLIVLFVGLFLYFHDRGVYQTIGRFEECEEDVDRTPSGPTNCECFRDPIGDDVPSSEDDILWVQVSPGVACEDIPEIIDDKVHTSLILMSTLHALVGLAIIGGILNCKKFCIRGL